tara:strand:+ start:1082 stop:2617 length:1536 start_codon:yes stop_codon:yes gene_type:complete
MTMMKLARLMEAAEFLTPTQQISLVSKEVDKFSDRSILFSILSLEYPSNNIGISKGKKWIAKALSVFEEEIISSYNALSDLGDVAYAEHMSKGSDRPTSLKTVLSLLSMDCGGLSSNEYALFESHFNDMSALERKWFIKYWIRTPRNGINIGVVQKMLAKCYDKKVSEVKHHTNFNSIHVTTTYYEMKEEPSCSLEHGKFLKPMLAKEIPMKKWPVEKIVDYKYDGNRYQVHKKGENVIVFNRKGKIVTPQFSDIVEHVKNYTVDCILDGEIYPIKDGGGPAPHQRLGTRVHSKDHAKAIIDCPVTWVAFDALMVDNETITDLPYCERLEKMSMIPDQAHRMDKGGDVLAFYNIAINDGFEGIIVKDANHKYQSAKRSVSWAKYKPPRIDLDVVILSARYGEGARSGYFASFDMGVKSEAGFMKIGSVGTGLSEKEMLSITNKLRTLVESYDGKSYHFLPKVVLEVTADLISRDTKGNIGLRFPRVVKIRDDKYVSDINTVADVIQTMNGF